MGAFAEIPSAYEANIFNITKNYKSKPLEGLNLINGILLNRYSCFSNEEDEAFVYATYPYSCVFYVNNLLKRKYAYVYYIGIYKDRKNRRVASLYLRRDWEWAETVISRRTYRDPLRNEIREIDNIRFYLKDNEDESLIKQFMENLIIKDLKSSKGLKIGLAPNKLRNIKIKATI